MRYARRFSDAFDVLVGVHNEVDYGRRGIQYIHYPTYFRPRPSVDFRWYHRFPPLLNTYYRFADSIGDFSFERMKANLSLTNSHWTAGKIRQFLGVAAQVLYPPVTRPATVRPWTDRQTGFLAVGRISPEKEFERVIGILAQVRKTVPSLTLTIVGTWDRKSEGYYRRLRSLADGLGAWISFRRDIAREDLAELMSTHRYGIHGMREEHFGMAPAEMAAAGMLVWVPAGGGQTEIVGDEPALPICERRGGDRSDCRRAVAPERAGAIECLSQRAVDALRHRPLHRGSTGTGRQLQRVAARAIAPNAG